MTTLDVIRLFDQLILAGVQSISVTQSAHDKIRDALGSEGDSTLVEFSGVRSAVEAQTDSNRYQLARLLAQQNEETARGGEQQNCVEE